VFQPLAGAKNFSYPKNTQVGSKSTRPPTGAPSTGVKWLDQKNWSLTPSIAEIRISGPIVVISHMP